MFILLIGPKGSGKSHIGRVLERRLGVRFFHVEPHWLAYHQECAEAGCQPTIEQGISQIHPLVEQALPQPRHVCVETTGASDEILRDLLSRAEPRSILMVRVRTPLVLCLTRIATRDTAQQIPADKERIRVVHELSKRRVFEHDVELHNTCLSDDDIVRSIGAHLAGEVRADHELRSMK